MLRCLIEVYTGSEVIEGSRQRCWKWMLKVAHEGKIQKKRHRPGETEHALCPRTMKHEMKMLPRLPVAIRIYFKIKHWDKIIMYCSIGLFTIPHTRRMCEQQQGCWDCGMLECCSGRGFTSACITLIPISAVKQS